MLSWLLELIKTVSEYIFMVEEEDGWMLMLM